MLNFLIFLLILGMLLVLMEPFFSSQKLPNKFISKKSLKKKALSAKIEQTYENLRELELDHKIGKISNNDYDRLQTGFKKRLSIIVSELNGYGHAHSSKNILSKIEAEALLKRKTSGVSVLEGNTAAEEIFKCPSCIKTIDENSNFCPECGKKLKCTNCSTIYLDDTIFCSNCGEKR